jgi:hypothetical protein
MMAGILISLIAASTPLIAQTNADDIAQLRQRIVHLEQQVQEISRVVEPLKARQAAENRRQTFRERFEKKMKQDREKYTAEQLGEAERLYQVANQKWGSTEALESLQEMVKKYPDINRTGCATLYVAQRSQGAERVEYLQDCIEKYNDCLYGDGVQVGAYARLLLADHYLSKGDNKKAAALYGEIKANYADAIDHSGKLLVDSIKTDLE